MFLWAGIDEAGYGPLLGPLVVAGTCFETALKPTEGFLWDLLVDSLSGGLKNLDGRVVVADSKLVYSRSRGLKHLEETVLCFAGCLGRRPGKVQELLASFCPELSEDDSPWFREAGDLKLPVATNDASIESKSAVLRASLEDADLSFLDAGIIPVLPAQYNRIVARTGNKSLLLWQKCGLLLQDLWGKCRGREGFVLVDRHGGRERYRKLLTDAFPDCRCDVKSEDASGSVYRLADAERLMWVAFKSDADSLALPVSLASMLAKYLRELYMLAFNSYWSGKIEGLRPTAGYAADARRFLRDIGPLTEGESFEMNGLVRQR